MVKVFPSYPLFLIQLFLLLTCGWVQSMTQEEFEEYLEEKRRLATETDEDSDEIKKVCPLESEPMIDLTFFIHTGSSLSNQDFKDVKQFIQDLSDYFFMTANSKKGMRLYGVSFAGPSEFQMSFAQKYSKRALIATLNRMIKMTGDRSDLYAAVKTLHERYSRRYRSSNSYFGNSAVFITNTVIDESRMDSLKAALDIYDAVICIGILQGDSLALRTQLTALASRLEDVDTISFYSYESYRKLKDSNKAEFAIQLCNWIRTPAPCKVPVAPEHGSVNFDETKVNSFAVYECNEGYDSPVSLTRTCTRYSTWSGSDPTCKRVCSRPQPPTHGKVTYEHLFVNSSVTFSCDKDYELDVNRPHPTVESKCLSSLRWSMNTPNCKKVPKKPSISTNTRTSPWQMMRNLAKNDNNGRSNIFNRLGSSIINSHMKFQLAASRNVRTTRAPQGPQIGWVVSLGLIQAGVCAAIIALVGFLGFMKFKAKKQAEEEKALVPVEGGDKPLELNTIVVDEAPLNPDAGPAPPADAPKSEDAPPAPESNPADAPAEPANPPEAPPPTEPSSTEVA